MVGDERQWVEFVIDDDEFLPVGDAAIAAGVATLGGIAQAQGVVASMPKLVDFAVEYWSGAEHPANL